MRVELKFQKCNNNSANQFQNVSNLSMEAMTDTNDFLFQVEKEMNLCHKL